MALVGGYFHLSYPFPFETQGLAADNAFDGLGKWLLCTFAICSLEGISSLSSRILGLDDKLLNKARVWLYWIDRRFIDIVIGSKTVDNKY